MDLLFSKYASPFSLLDELIANGDFFDWSIEFVDAENDRRIWELWLHKVFDKSYEEFRNAILKTENVIDEHLETTIQDSKSILNNFIPETGVKTWVQK